MVRIKHRYLLIHILYPDPNSTTVKSGGKSLEELPYSVQFRQPSSDQLNGKVLMRVLRDGVADLFGDYGSGKVAGSLQVKYFSPTTSTAIVRGSRDPYRLVWAALTYTTRLPKPIDQRCVFQIVRVSGTIKKAEEEAIRRARLSIRKAQKPSISSTSKALVIEGDSDGIDVDMLNDTDGANGLDDGEITEDDGE